MKFILTADWHLRATQPRCRIDKDWMQTQRNALNQVFEYASSYHCDILVVGDIFHSNSDASFQCIQMVQDLADKLNNIGKGLFILCGNHDLLYHSSQNIDKSAIGILIHSNNIYPISYYDSRISAPNFDEPCFDNEYIFRHILTFPDEKSMPPNISGTTADELLEKYTNAKWIFTGDYHKSFCHKKNGRYVINSGCLICQATDFKDYQPGVYYIDTDHDIVNFLPITDNKEYIDDSYILKQDEREKRLDDFIKKVDGTKAMSLDFIENIENELSSGDYSKEFADEVRKFIGV